MLILHCAGGSVHVGKALAGGGRRIRESHYFLAVDNDREMITPAAQTATPDAESELVLARGRRDEDAGPPNREAIGRTPGSLPAVD